MSALVAVSMYQLCQHHQAGPAHFLSAWFVSEAAALLCAKHLTHVLIVDSLPPTMSSPQACTRLHTYNTNNTTKRSGTHLLQYPSRADYTSRRPCLHTGPDPTPPQQQTDHVRTCCNIFHMQIILLAANCVLSPSQQLLIVRHLKGVNLWVRVCWNLLHLPHAC